MRDRGGGARGVGAQGASVSRSSPATEAAGGDGTTADGAPARWVDPIERIEANWRAHGWAAGPRLKTILSVLRVAELSRAAAREVLRGYHLTEARHEMLAVLYFSSTGELPMGQIGRRLMIHPARVTSTIGFLEEAGFVERVTSTTDRRTVLARITLDGRRAMEDSTEAMAERQFNLGALTDAEADELFRILRQVRVACTSMGDDQGAGLRP